MSALDAVAYPFVVAALVLVFLVACAIDRRLR